MCMLCSKLEGLKSFMMCGVLLIIKLCSNVKLLASSKKLYFYNRNNFINIFMRQLVALPVLNIWGLRADCFVKCFFSVIIDDNSTKARMVLIPHKTITAYLAIISVM